MHISAHVAPVKHVVAMSKIITMDILSNSNFVCHSQHCESSLILHITADFNRTSKVFNYIMARVY